MTWNDDIQPRRSEILIQRRMLFAICTLLISGCDPVISVAGAQFPVWMLCLIFGILVSLALRPIFLTTGIDDWMTPRPLIYLCLALVIAFVCWLVGWR